MMYWHDGWAWFWMIPMMLFWIVALGAVIYAAGQARQPRLTPALGRGQFRVMAVSAQLTELVD